MLLHFYRHHKPEELDKEVQIMNLKEKGASLVAQMVKNLAAMQETQV